MVMLRGRLARRIRSRRNRTRKVARPTYRTRSITRRTYQGGYSKFGKISQPELKQYESRVNRLTFTPLVSQGTFFLPPAGVQIEQGVNEDQRVGNRINAKFLTVKSVLKGINEPGAGARSQFVRWVIWQPKGNIGLPPTEALANAYIGQQSLTSYINTKTVRILKHGMVNLGANGSGKMLVENFKLNNRMMNFSQDLDNFVDTKSWMYITFISDSEVVSVENQNKFYFADP